MNKELILALKELEKERKINFEILLDVLKAALLSAYKKNFKNEAKPSDIIDIYIDSDSGDIKVLANLTVVERVTNPTRQISLEEARKIVANCNPGDAISQEVTPKDFGRIAAQTAKQVIVQRIREAEREIVFEEFIDLAPGDIDFIQYLIKKTNSQLESNFNALKIRYYTCFDDLSLPKSVLSKEQSFNVLIKELGFENNLASDEKNPSKQPPKNRNDKINFVTFDVEKIDSGGRGKAKYLFEDSDLFVEEVAIKFYENLGYNALWSEDFYWGFLMALLFWDVIFARINGVFNEGFPLASQFNDMPHDFFKPEFYLRRKNLINNRLNQLNNNNIEQEISNSYKINYGKSCRPIERWDRFTQEELLIPTKTMNKTMLLGILERLISNFAENRSGLPDLIVYNNNELFFSEVKSERDRVSDKQMSWHLFLAKKMDIKVDLFLVNHTERKVNNLKSKYSLYEEFEPEGSLEEFKDDLALMQDFATDLTNMINNIKFTVDKDGNEDKKIKSKIQEVQNEINQRKKELDRKLKVLSSEIIIVRVLKDKTNPYNFEFEISTDEKN